MSTQTWSRLPGWRFQILARDTRSIITSVFLGLIMTIILQISGAFDTAVTGGTIPVTAAIVCSAIWLPAAMFYGLTGGLITAWINPIISNLTASSPMAPFLFLTNGSHTVTVALCTWAVKRRGLGLRLWQVVVIGQLGGLADACVYGLGNRVILHMPWSFIQFQVLATQPCYLVGSILTFVIMRRLLRTGLIRRDVVGLADTVV